MNITLNKLLDYVNNNYTRIIIEKNDNKYTNFINSIFNFAKNYNSEDKFVFAEFDMLSELLTNENFKIKEQYDIVYTILNIDLNLTQNGPVNFDPYKIMNIYTVEEYDLLEEIAKTINLDKLILNQEMCNNKKAIKLLQKYSLLKRNYIDGLELLKESNFFTGNYTTTDIYQIVSALNKLGFSDVVSTNIEKVLLNKLNKKVDSKNITINFVKTDEKKEKLLTDKEYKELKSKIKKVYDAYNGRILKALTYSEAIEIGNMLYTLGYDDSEIQRFFMNFSRNYYMSMLDTYLYNYDKLKFYEEKCGYNLSILNEYYNEFLASSDEDKMFWKNEFETLLINILHKIENHYEYEIQKSKKLSLNKKV